MKAVITAMKAPWPAGAQVGDVVEFAGGSVPGWALGKCTEAPSDAKVTAHFPEPEDKAATKAAATKAARAT